MNTAARDRVLLHTVQDYFKGSEKGRRTPISKLALSKGDDGGVLVRLHTSRPNIVRMEAQAITDALRERVGGDRKVSVIVIPEARAVVKFVRVTPRKARLVIDAIKGKRVSEALGILRFVPNHAAEIISKVLSSAAANAQDGWGAGVEELKVQNILADGGPSLKRVKPRAQGRAYRILKRTSHLTVILTEAPAPAARPRRAASPARPKGAAPVAAPAAAPTPALPVAQTAETPPIAEEPQEATPVTESDAPEISVADREPDADDADQKRSEGE